MDFSGFTADSFEQLINALSIKIFGSGTSIFGNGPDGGREATFNGKVDYPNNTTDAWDGYGVIQAKFKERTEDRAAEFKWAKIQLTKELKAWEKSEKRTPKPDYFIFCTNVELTSASGGGKDQLNNLIEGYKEKLSLKGYSIWDLDKLSSLIDGQSDIRQRFKAFFTTGDLLAEISEHLKFDRSTTSTLRSYIRNEFRNEQIAKTSQGGDRTESQVNLADVFMDLPSATSPNAQNNDSNDNLRSIPALLTSSACKLDPISITQCSSLKGTAHCAQYVFIGGPGSGKSTIGQFISQINRAAILDRIPQHKLTLNIISEVAGLKKSCNKLGFEWPKTPRYPYRIDLNQFAKDLTLEAQAGGVDTLSMYIRAKISQNETISHRQLIEWFAEFPSILIFDGLDEVPVSSNREQVIDQIQSFLGEIREYESDVLIIASSRPDGYRNEFDNMGVVIHRYLLPLNKQQALKCSEKYLINKYKDCDESRLANDMEVLKTSVDNPLIEKLMQTPLQVTFMVTVVSAFGKPSESRWKLFNDYYTTIYTRELQKSVPPFGKILKERAQDIDELHHNVGFILQNRAELSGETSAEMNISEFKQLVQNTLEENGLEGDELSQEKRMLVGAAKERLVFITSKKDLLLSFDVRSLQEYMAAMAITNADSGDIVKRLKMVAASQYWRNTLLFAIGRFFSDSHFRKSRDNIRILCDDLNREGKIEYQFIKLGSLIALEILESGTLGNTPSFVRNLSAIALELLDIYPSEKNYSKRLAQIYDEKLSREFEKELKTRLGQKAIERSYSAWMLIGYLREKQVKWVDDVMAEFWPKLDSDIRQITEALSSQGLMSETEQNTLFNYYLSLPFKEVWKNIPRFEQRFSGALAIFPQFITGVTKRILIPENSGLNDSGMSTYVTGLEINSSKSDIELVIDRIKQSNHDRSWDILVLLYEFILEPNHDRLINAVCSIKNNLDLLPHGFLLRAAPWIVNIILDKNIVSDMTKYHFGHLELWQETEASLQNNTNSLNELTSFKVGSTTFDILSAAQHCSSRSQEGLLKTNELITQINNETLPCRENTLTSILFHISGHSKYLYQINIDTLRKIAKNLELTLYPHSFPILLNRQNISDDDITSWVDFYDELFSSVSTMYSHSNNFRGVETSFLIELYRDYQSKISLLKLAAFMCAAGEKIHVDYSFIIDNANSSNEDDCIFFFIFELLACSDLDILSNKLIFIMKSATEGDSGFILSFFTNNTIRYEAAELLLRTFILNIKECHWHIKAAAQDLYIDLIQSTKSDLTAEVVRSLSLPILE